MAQERDQKRVRLSQEGIRHRRRGLPAKLQKNNDDNDNASDDDRGIGRDPTPGPRNFVDLLKGKGKNNFTPPPFLDFSFPVLRPPTTTSTSTTSTVSLDPVSPFPTSTKTLVPPTILPPAEPVQTTPPPTISTPPTISQPSTISPTTPVPSSTEIPTTLSTRTIINTTTSFDVVAATYTSTPASMDYGTLSPARTAGIALGTICLVAPTKSNRSSSPVAQESLVQSSASFDGVISSTDNTGGKLSAATRHTNAGGGVPERPKPTLPRWVCQIRQIIPQNVLSPVVEEDEQTQSSSLSSSSSSSSRRSIGKKSTTRSIASRVFGRHRRSNPSPSSLERRLAGTATPPDGISAEGSTQNNDSFRHSSASDLSSTWMTMVTEKTDSTFFPPTALSHPSVPPMARRAAGVSNGGGTEQESSRWLRPPTAENARYSRHSGSPRRSMTDEDGSV
ncbi:hypothetical protein B0H66DRAFT_621404 [Apodospora peruviana]|uniref:Uncharacterized protein n=1 Tax=Apodospora peruviana TaxID=516989 RepID=A0AAE0I3J7_9PEZI|nr:hypothetical protein B0H66DRAFT_621404 [Apodospora peruviana]